MKKSNAPAEVQEQQSELEISHAIRGANRDNAEAQLRKVARINHRLQTESMHFNESYALKAELDAILAEWLD